jgi:predicted dehydrogenase
MGNGMEASNGQRKAKLKFAVVGLGEIAQKCMLPAFANAQESVELTALVSGSEEKLRELGDRYGVEELHTYNRYDELLDSGNVHAVYLALPNRLHAEYAVRALDRGVHVLCEKPLATSEEDCRRMLEASRETGAKLMTAYRLHFEEANLKAIECARERLGNLRYFTSNFSFNLQDLENIRLRGDEGGPLWDVGIYCINAARYFFRSEPTEVSALCAASEDPRFAEVPETVSVQLKFPGERIASFVCSFGSEKGGAYEVFGTEGKLRLENAYELSGERELTVTAGGKTERTVFAAADQFAPQLIYFADCVRRNHQPETSGFEGWADVRIMRAVHESILSGSRVVLGPPPQALADKERPDLSQWIAKPPVEAPGVVKPSGEEAA